MRITRRCTLISLSAIVSPNRLNPIMQRAKIDRSVPRATSVYDNGTVSYFPYKLYQVTPFELKKYRINNTLSCNDIKCVYLYLEWLLHAIKTYEILACDDAHATLEKIWPLSGVQPRMLLKHEEWKTYTVEKRQESKLSSIFFPPILDFNAFISQGKCVDGKNRKMIHQSHCPMNRKI